MKKQLILIICAIILVLLTGVLASAECRIKFTTKINGYSGASFEAGILNTATDNYDALFDVLQPGMPGGKYTQMRSLVDGKALTKDFRSDSDNKKWEITKISVDPDWVGLSGTDSLIWTINCPDNIKLSLIDYGNDKTRINIVKTINLKETNSYNINVSKVMGPYRYLDLIINKTVCIENWKCTAWSECVNGKQTRTCTDKNKCGTIANKPIEEKSCKVKPGKASETTLQTTASANTSATESEVIRLNQPNETETENSSIIYLNKKQEEKSIFEIIKEFFAGIF